MFPRLTGELCPHSIEGNYALRKFLFVCWGNKLFASASEFYTELNGKL
jgi:hypothetical protein